MFRRIVRFIFLILVFISGVLVGGINTSKIISYARQIDDNKQVEKQQIQQKPQRLKKKIRKIIQVV